MPQKESTRVHLGAICFLIAVFIIGYFTISSGEESNDGIVNYSVPCGDSANSGLPEISMPYGIKSYIGQLTSFDQIVIGEHRLGDVIFEWDFDGDGNVDHTSQYGFCPPRIFRKEGTFWPTLTVSDRFGHKQSFSLKLDIEVGLGQQTTLAPEKFKTRCQKAIKKTDKITKTKYAILHCGVNTNSPYDARFYHDVAQMYHTLINDYGFEDSNIYTLSPPCTTQSFFKDSIFESHIDFNSGSIDNLDSAFYLISQNLGPADELYMLFSGHGNGQRVIDHSLNEDPHYDPGDFEQETCEDTIQSIYTPNLGLSNLPKGLNEWVGRFFGRDSTTNTLIGRSVYQARYDSILYRCQDRSVSYVSNSDVFVEGFSYAPLGDTNFNGVIEPFEVWDWDDDGNPPITLDTITGDYIYDNDDWDTISYTQSCNLNALYNLHGRNYIYFDYGFDNKLDIDMNAHDSILLHPEDLDINGTDSNNDGILLTIDINDDGDTNDSLSIDETIMGWPGQGISDDFVRMWLDSLDLSASSAIFQNCYSGGFVDDLSRSGMVVMAPCADTQLAWGNGFLQSHIQTMRGIKIDYAADDTTDVSDSVDANGDGCFSFAEIFDYANSYTSSAQFRQLDDNGDHVGHGSTLPNGDDGYYAGKFSYDGVCYSTDTTGYIYGDADNSGATNIGDALYINNYIFNGGNTPDPLNAGDPNGSCAINIGDVVFMINFIFNQGDDPVAGCVE